MSGGICPFCNLVYVIAYSCKDSVAFTKMRIVHVIHISVKDKPTDKGRFTPHAGLLVFAVEDILLVIA